MQWNQYQMYLKKRMSKSQVPRKGKKADCIYLWYKLISAAILNQISSDWTLALYGEVPGAD